MKKVNISVVICQYNPTLKKTKRTLESVLCQKEVSYEIIVSDDGSTDNLFESIKHILKKHEFENYNLVESDCNTGTVKNCLRALEKVNGEYVYFLSQGDMLYDENVLHDMLNYIEIENVDNIFGNAVDYHFNSLGEVVVEGMYPNLLYPPFFSSNSNKKTLYVSMRNFIVGTSLLRKTISAKKYINMVADCSKYVEDNTSLLLGLLYGSEIRYYDRNVVWYEYGGGVSTTTNVFWQQELQKDFKQTVKKIKKLFPKDRIVDELYCYYMDKGLYRSIRLWLGHPFLQLYRFYFMFKYRNYMRKKTYDKNKIIKLVER